MFLFKFNVTVKKKTMFSLQLVDQSYTMSAVLLQLVHTKRLRFYGPSSISW